MSSIPSEALLRFEFDALRALAAQVLDEHVNDHGTCRVCRCRFPCRRACLAEHNLAVCDCTTVASAPH
jgi:hypothetical protein